MKSIAEMVGTIIGSIVGSAIPSLLGYLFYLSKTSFSISG